MKTVEAVARSLIAVGVLVLAGAMSSRAQGVVVPSGSSGGGGGGCGTATSKTANYTALSTDSGKTLVFNGSSLTLTLPASPPSSTWAICVQNINATVLTVSPNGLNIDGSASSVTLDQNQGLTISTDGSNYFTMRGTGGVPARTTAGNASQALCETPSGGAAGTIGWCGPGITVTSQTGTTFTPLENNSNSTIGTCIEQSNAGVITDTIPDQATGNFTAGYYFCILNKGAGTITVNRTSASTFNLFGALSGTAQTTFNITAGQAAYFYYGPTAWDVAVVGGGLPCTTTANSLQYNNVGAFGCVTEYTYGSSTITSAAAGKLDLSAQNTADSFKIPYGGSDLSGSSGGGLRIATGGGLEWDNAGSRLYAAAVAGSSGTQTNCDPTNSGPGAVWQLNWNIAPGCVRQSAMVTGSDYTNATTTLSNVTGLSFSLNANEQYAISCKLIYQGSATTASLVLSSTGPASPTKVTAQALQDTTTGASGAIYLAATDGATFGFSLGPTAIVSTATDLYSTIDIGIVNGSNAGTFQLQAKSNGTGTVTIKVGSFCKYQ